MSLNRKLDSSLEKKNVRNRQITEDEQTYYTAPLRLLPQMCWEQEKPANNLKMNIKESVHKPGSTHANCDKKGCEFHRGIDTFTMGKEKGYVKVKVYQDGCRVTSVKIKSVSGGRDYSFSGDEIVGIEKSKFIEKGTYRIIPEYKFIDTGSNYVSLTVFVRW